MKPHNPSAHTGDQTNALAEEHTTNWPAWLRWGLTASAVLLTLAVFGLYQRPDFLMTLADQLWACF